MQRLRNQKILRGPNYYFGPLPFFRVNFSVGRPLIQWKQYETHSLSGTRAMASLPLFDRSLQNGLVAPSRQELDQRERRVVADMRESLTATVTLALAGVLAIGLLEAWDLSATLILGLQEIIGVVVFATCTWFMYERGENKLHLYSFEAADHTMIGEIRALLNRLPDGAAYQQAIDAEQRSYTTGEFEEIRTRVRAFSPAE
jgi:hypothetical protein